MAETTEMTALERAARALLALDYPEAIRSDAEGMYWDRRGLDYLDQARAVLDAIREPSEAMERAMIALTGDMAVQKRDGTTYRHVDVFAAMIGAALEEK